MPEPTTYEDRIDYLTGTGSPSIASVGRNAGMSTNVGNTVLGFEFAARIFTSGAWLTYLHVAMHQTTSPGIYVLLLDITATTTPIDGMVARETLGPTPIVYDPAGVVQQVGATIVFSESVAEAPHIKGGPRGVCELEGLPYDNGLVAILSTTPGVLTMLVGPNSTPAVGGARFHARGQKCWG